jgi:hypothetical protein
MMADNGCVTSWAMEADSAAIVVKRATRASAI